MISPEQLEARTRKVGGSDAHVILGVDGPGGRTRLDLWASKRRGRHLELPPIKPPEPPDDSATYWGNLYADKIDPRDVGSEFEAAVVRLYESRTGNRTAEAPTMQHPTLDFVAANPDRVVFSPDSRELVGDVSFDTGSPVVSLAPKPEGGLECKLVGRWATGPWDGDVLPEYVRCQSQWCMGVSGLPHWDVAAWIAGTEVRVRRVFRDEELIAAMFELATLFWEENVLANVPPEPRGADDLLRFLAGRHPKDDGEMLTLEGEAGAQARALSIRYDRLREAEKRIKDAKKLTVAQLAALTGSAKGLEGPWGKFIYPGRVGQVSWKKVAEEMGSPPDELVESHRGAPFRAPNVYLAKDLRPWKK